MVIQNIVAMRAMIGVDENRATSFERIEPTTV
jgi:hypothetical protein